MSTGQQCDVVEFRPGLWIVYLESMMDWGEDEDGRGDGQCLLVRQPPQPTAEDAYTLLRDQHANPGGYCAAPYQPHYQRHATPPPALDDL